MAGSLQATTSFTYFFIQQTIFKGWSSRTGKPTLSVWSIVEQEQIVRCICAKQKLKYPRIIANDFQNYKIDI
jgi:hypothetical protein